MSDPPWHHRRVSGDPPNDPDPRWAADERVVGEPRWPMVGALLVAIVLFLLLPPTMRAGPSWLIPVVEAGLLVALIVGDPGRIDRRSVTLRRLSLSLVTLLVIESLWATARLVRALIEGTDPAVNSAGSLLAAGAVVWVSNNIAFSLLYWDLDGGGSAARAHHMPRYPELGFPQLLNPHVAPPGWRPRFVDYVYLGFTNATAFSPTDVMPLVPWAKIAMALQSVISLTILGLVIARAVNVFS